jgi:NADH-quinone oxidoreductase subunit L
MAGPTPISALIHAATMVAAGVYLLARVFPIVQASEMAMHTIAWVGAFTALFAATIALCQRDIKKALAYSTCSQLGYMVMSIGVGAWVAAIFHLVTHAFFKALLFLGSGSVIHGCHHEQDMSRYGGLARKMPVTASTFLIATMAISGVPGLSGFWSKERIIEATHFYPVVYWIAIGVAFLTALYMFRIYFLTFAGSYRGDDESHVHESPPSMTVPLVILALPSALLGLLGAGGDLFGNFLGHGHHVSFLEMLLAPAAWLALAGILVAWLIYARGGSVPVIGPLHRFLRELWYVDRAYGWLLRKVIMPSFDALWRLIDKVLIDGGLAEFLVWLQRRGGGLLAQLQSGQSQTYLGVGLSFLIAVLAVMVFSLAQYQSALDALVARMSSQ